jgi:uncharacterized protein (TIGR02466 family)
MALYPTTFKSTAVKHMFATPLVISELPEEVANNINPIIQDMILERSRHNESVHVSNHGGWQSDDKLTEWGGEPVSIILSCLRELLSQITVYVKDRKTFHRGNIDWKINGWANINRKGNSNIPHVHPGAYWSAVYYVAVDEDDNKGGDIEFVDPRGCLPTIYCPILHIGIQGYINAGSTEIHKPKEGQCLIFPSWLYHSVMPYIGDKTRISLAFNFAV